MSNMNQTIQEQAARFERLMDQCGVEWNAENVLLCIAVAKEAMQHGEVSVEAYYAAKRILIERLEAASELLN